MLKSVVAGRGLHKHEQPGPVGLPNVVEGQISELCRDLAEQAKRLRQLQEQADELRTVIRQWVGGLERDSARRSPSRAGRR